MKKYNIKRLFHYISPHKKYFILSIILSIISVLANLLIPVFTGRSVDAIFGVGKVDFQALVTNIIALGGVVLISALFLYLTNLAINMLSLLVIRDMRADIFSSIAKSKLSFLDKNEEGDLTSRVTNDVEIVAEGLLSGANQLLIGIFSIVGTLILMFFTNYVVALTVAILTPLSLLCSYFITKISYKQHQKNAKFQGEIANKISELLNGSKEIKVFNAEDKKFEEFKALNEKLNKVGKKAQFYSSLTNPTTRFVNGLIYALVGVIGGVYVVKKFMTVGNLTTFLQYANQYSKPFNEISGVISNLQSAFSSLERIFEVIDMEKEDYNGEKLKLQNDYEIEFKDVCFSYEKSKPLIENFNLKVKKGDVVAICGKTGSGKTTLINLIMRFFELNSGEILLNGKNIDEINLSDYRDLFGMVLQETWLKDATVKENIAYGNNLATMEEINDSVEKSYLKDIVSKLEKGMDTKVDSASRLSQGERQLLSISRVMLKKPQILILDEATSSIDTWTEQKIQSAFSLLMRGKTSFIVAHRLSTITSSDIILVMDKGKIVEQGTSEELLALKGYFYRLVKYS